MAKDISMRHTKLKAEEVALIAGEIFKPSWESRNEGIHERISFEDTIWGFDLAGGAYYKTPLRVTYVKPDSRAEKANVRPGDLLLRINNIDTSTMTIQEAHDIIVESGINIKLNVTAPEDITDSFYYYEDPTLEEAALAQKRLDDEKARRAKWFKPRDGAYMKLQWPWVSKRCLVYRESNCFLVPSKYEELHKDKFPEPIPSIRYLDNVILDNMDKERHKMVEEMLARAENEKLEKLKVDNKTQPNNNVSKDNDQNVENGTVKPTEKSEIEVTQDHNDGTDVNSEENDAASIAFVEEDIDEDNDNTQFEPTEDNTELNDSNNNEPNLIKRIDEDADQDNLAEEPTLKNDENQIQSGETDVLEDENDVIDMNGDSSPDLRSDHDEEVDNTTDIIDNIPNGDIVYNGSNDEEVNKVTDLNNNSMTDLVNELSDTSEGSADNRNI